MNSGSESTPVNGACETSRIVCEHNIGQVSNGLQEIEVSININESEEKNETISVWFQIENHTASSNSHK